MSGNATVSMPDLEKLPCDSDSPTRAHSAKQPSIREEIETLPGTRYLTTIGHKCEPPWKNGSTPVTSIAVGANSARCAAPEPLLPCQRSEERRVGKECDICDER